MRFFQTIQESLYNPSFYVRVKTEPMRIALRHFSLLIICITIVTIISLYASFGAWSEGVTVARDYQQKIINLYPDELELTFSKGKATSNVAEPYSIALPADFVPKETDPKIHVPRNLIVINTTGTVSVADFATYDTYAILGGDAIGFNDTSNGKVEIRQFSQFRETIILNKTRATELINIAARYLKVFALTLLVLLPLIIFGVIWVGFLAYLLFGAGVVWLVAKLRKTELTYGEAYKMSLYLIILPLLYQLLAGFFPIFSVPYLFTLILALMAYLNLTPVNEVNQGIDTQLKPEENDQEDRDE